MPEQLIYESGNSQIYLLDSREGQPRVIRKTLNNEYPPPAEIERFYNEYHIAAELNIEGVRKVVSRDRYQRRHALMLEYVDMPTLAEALAGEPAELDDFFGLAISIATAIGEVHKHHIIHKDISPSNILVDVAAQRACIIDFGLSSRLSLKQPNLGNPENLEGNLTYISPEQTGRMNRVVDYRTDLYSMGVVFYEMLTGRQPFIGKDAMELVHAHIAADPVPAYRQNAVVSAPLSAVIERLLQKNAEDRYQSAYGVVADLRRCQESWQKTGEIAAFTLAQKDFSGRFQIPQRLFGRENEIDRLMTAFGEVSEGALKLLLVAGYSGTGKSALVHEIHRPITARHGHFIEGKFDQYQRGKPYFAILQAFRDYVALLLTENEATLTPIREAILAAVGGEGRVLTDVIPNLVHLIGEQAEVPVVGGSEAQNRFNYVFSKFVRAISTKAHPIVLFIDDLQWADSASLNLLKTLMSDAYNGYLLCIGAYRDNEVSASHPFMISLAEMRELEVDVDTIEIGNLSLEDVRQMLALSVAMPADAADVIQLAELIYAKTSGNAFFVTKFLNALYEDGLLRFEHADRRWSWEYDAITQRNITSNVVELMASKVRKLDAEVQKVLRMAACVGAQFDEDTVATIVQVSPEAVREAIQKSMAQGLVVPITQGEYKFSHDRIQQAVYSLIPEADRAKVHRQVGQLLLASTGADQRDEKLFDIVNQCNAGQAEIHDQEEKTALALLNLQAGEKAKQASAFKPAYTYLQNGIDLLPDDHWQLHYELSRDLHTLAAETAYLNADFELMESNIIAVLENTTDILDKVLPYEIRILAYKAQNRLLDAIQAGLDVLAQLGERFPSKPGMPHVMRDLAATKLKLRGKNAEALASMPDMADPQKIAAMRIIADIASSSYWATPNLFPLLIFRMCHLSLKNGNTALSAFGFSAYGVILCGVLGQMREGYTYGKLGLQLLDRYNEKAWLTQIYTPIYALIINWNEHVRNTLSPLQESYHIGLEVGAIEFACINANIYCIHAYLSGRPLDKIEAETQAYSQSFQFYKQETNANYNEVYHQGMLNLMGRSVDPVVLTGEAYDEAQMMAQNIEREDKTGRFFIHFNKLILCYLFQDYAQARDHAEAARELLEAVLAKFEIPNHHYYEALTLLVLYPDAEKSVQGKMRRRVQSNLRKMQKWAKDAPENYLHKAKLIEAEFLRVSGKSAKAAVAYDAAISGASEQAYIHEEALGYELAARFFLVNQAETLGDFYMKAACNAYREWGATAKVNQLEQRYPQYLSSLLQPAQSLSSTSSVQGMTTVRHRYQLDLITVLKAATAISGEIVLKDLLQMMMQIVVENAGAQRAVLMLMEGETLMAYREWREDIDNTTAISGTPLSQVDSLAKSVVQYVQNTQESVVINDAQNDERYAKDPYILAQQPKSVMAVPIINQGKFIGVIYLENNLSIGAFTQHRVDTLALLSGQIAVSIDNAMLYENLEQKVVERTRELTEEKQKSDRLLLNILPAQTAKELKEVGKAKPRSYRNVTVMFTDFCDFTRVSSRLSASELVEEINTCFAAFDEIVAAHNVEKIKTIGDAYMCAGGLPAQNATHAQDVVGAALEIRQWVSSRNAKRSKQDLPVLPIRIGVHSGPVVAGVVGTRKFAYDIWGETVNVAARMEQTSEPGKVNISGATWQQVKDQFACSHRGKLAAKNLDEIDMYFVA